VNEGLLFLLCLASFSSAFMVGWIIVCIYSLCEWYNDEPGAVVRRDGTGEVTLDSVQLVTAPAPADKANEKQKNVERKYPSEWMHDERFLRWLDERDGRV